MERVRDSVWESEREKDTTAPTLITLWDCCVCIYIFFYVPCRRSAVPFQCEALARVRPARVYFPRFRRLTELRSRLRRLTKKSLLRFRRRRRLRRRWWRLWRHNNRSIIIFFFTSPVVIGDTAVICSGRCNSAENSQVRPQYHIRLYRGGIFAFIRVKVSSFKIHCTVYIHIDLFFRVYIYAFKISKSD